MRKVTNTNRTRISPIFVAILLLFLSSNVAHATGDSTYTFSGGITLDFLGVKYDSLNKSNQDTTRIYYKMYIPSSAQDVSHFVVKTGTCVSTAKGGTFTGSITSPTLNYSGCIKFGIDKSDPNSPQMFGAKYDCQSDKGKTHYFFVEIYKIVAIDVTEFAIKPGSSYYKGTLLGFNDSCQGPVPVTWYKTNAHVGDGTILVEFSTATELNNEKFEIERSNGDGNFVKIGEIAGAGNSSQILKYQFVDNHPLPGTNYYRIKQIDFDGKWAYSKIFSAKIDPNPGLEVYPNPVNSDEMVTLSAFGFEKGHNHTITVRDIVGKTVLESVFSGTGNILYLNLPKGMYQITAVGKDAMNRDTIFQKRLLVQ